VLDLFSVQTACPFLRWLALNLFALEASQPRLPFATASLIGAVLALSASKPAGERIECEPGFLLGAVIYAPSLSSAALAASLDRNSICSNALLIRVRASSNVSALLAFSRPPRVDAKSRTACAGKPSRIGSASRRLTQVLGTFVFGGAVGWLARQARLELALLALSRSAFARRE